MCIRLLKTQESFLETMSLYPIIRRSLIISPMIRRSGQISSLRERQKYALRMFGIAMTRTLLGLLNIQAGEKVALVGENGAGKTTLMKLACGLLTPVKGRILFNGVDLQRVNPKERYRAVSMVFQEVLIFAMSVGENICCCPETLIDEERLWGVIEKAGLTEVIRALPDGWRTPMTTYVEPGGINLSGGQNQRLMLARALYKGGDFLVLDEPTSALDPLAEEALYEEYYRFTKNQRAVFISHRLSSTQFCDRVIFLKEGRIVQSGTHKDLASKEGPYKRMFDTQARYYQKEVLV